MLGNGGATFFLADEGGGDEGRGQGFIHAAGDDPF